MGVAQASIGSGFSKQIFIVARYRPGGNFIRRFKANVGEKRLPRPSTASLSTPASSPEPPTTPLTTLMTVTTPEAALGIF